MSNNRNGLLVLGLCVGLCSSWGAIARELRCNNENVEGEMIETWEASEFDGGIQIRLTQKESGEDEVYRVPTSGFLSSEKMGLIDDRDFDQVPILRSGNPYVFVVDWANSYMTLAAYGGHARELFTFYPARCVRLD
jgi:hypothetical protein